MSVSTTSKDSPYDTYLYAPLPSIFNLDEFAQDLRVLRVDDTFWKRKQSVRGMKQVQRLFFIMLEVFGALKEIVPARNEYYTESVLNGSAENLFKQYCRVLEMRLEHATYSEGGPKHFFEWLTNMQEAARKQYETSKLSLIYKSGVAPTSEEIKYKECLTTEFKPVFPSS
jgi:hypothetical protein